MAIKLRRKHEEITNIPIKLEDNLFIKINNISKETLMSVDELVNLGVGFIKNDLSKIQANIKHLGYLVAKYIANACGKEITENVASTNTSKPSSALIRVYSDNKQVGAYSNLDNAIAEAKRCLSISSTRIVRLERI